MEINKFYNMDCMEGMKQFPNKYFDLAIVDPPYGIDSYKNGTMGGSIFTKTSKHKPVTWDKESPNEDYFKELLRVSKNQIIWGANHFISKIPYDSSCWIVWDKYNGENNFADCELAWTSFKTSVRIFRYMWQGMNQGKSIDEGHIMQGDKSKNEKRIHPTQKPVNLYIWLLQKYAKPNDKILDTHAGSASSLIACHKLGFDYIGFEIDKNYYENAAKRLEDEKAQINLFRDYLG